MKTHEEIQEYIDKVTNDNWPLFNRPPIQIGNINALLQIGAINKLEALYWCLGEARPKFRYDGEDR